MGIFDREYKKIVETINEKGTWSEGNVRTKYADGTPAHYKSYIGYQFRLDNSTDEAHLTVIYPDFFITSIRLLYLYHSFSLSQL